MGWTAAPPCGGSITQRGEGEQGVKYNQVRTKWPHPICCERESGSQACWRQKRTRCAVLPCPALMGLSATVSLTWVPPVCQVGFSALTVESGAPAVFRQARLAELAWDDSNQVGSNQAAVVWQVALTADLAALVCFRLIGPASNQADSSRVDSNRVAAVHLVCPADRSADSGPPVCSRPALSAGLASADSADLVSLACLVVRHQASAFLDLECRVFRACWAYPVLVCLELVCLERDGDRREGFPGVRVSVPEKLVAGSEVDDSPSCHGIPDDWPTRSVADDTNNVADDKGFPSRSNSCDCSRPASLPNSIPNHPIPRAGYL